MLVNTKFLGSIEVQKDSVISFEQGLPGFGDLHAFALLPVEGNATLNYLQSLEQADICFVVVNPFLIIEEYDIDISEATVAALGIENISDISLFSILTVTEDIRNITANLAAPVVVNAANRKARQEILGDSKYEVRYKLYREE